MRFPFKLVTEGADIYHAIAYRNGLGQHTAVLPPNSSLKEEKATFWFELIYVLAIGLNKLSILFFYRRLFPQKSVLVILQLVGLTVLLWQVAIGIGFILQCNPVERAWDKTVPGHCINVVKLWLGNAIPNIVTDLVIIVIPLPLVWNLQMRRSQKIAVCGIFLTGGL